MSAENVLYCFVIVLAWFSQDLQDIEQIGRLLFLGKFFKKSRLLPYLAIINHKYKNDQKAVIPEIILKISTVITF